MSKNTLTLEQLQTALAPLNEQLAANTVYNEEIKQLLLSISAKLDVNLAKEEPAPKKAAKKTETKKRAPRKKKDDSDEEVPEKKRTTRKKKDDSDEEVPEKKRATKKKAVKTAPEEFKSINRLQFFNKEFKEKGTAAFPQLTEDVVEKLKDDANFDEIPEEKQQETLRSLCYKYMSTEHNSVLMSLKAAYNDRGMANKVVIEEKDDE